MSQRMMTWDRNPGPTGATLGATWELRDSGGSPAGPTGVIVNHCGHPTAIYPYTVELPWEPWQLLAPNGKGFMHLMDAKNAAVRRYWECAL